MRDLGFVGLVLGAAWVTPRGGPVPVVAVLCVLTGLGPGSWLGIVGRVLTGSVAGALVWLQPERAGLAVAVAAVGASAGRVPLANVVGAAAWAAATMVWVAPWSPLWAFVLAWVPARLSDNGPRLPGLALHYEDQSWHLDRPVIIIGHHERASDIVLPRALGVDALHCRVEAVGRNVSVVPLSLRGVVVESGLWRFRLRAGSIPQRARLLAGDRLRLGASSVVFRVVEA